MDCFFPATLKSSGFIQGLTSISILWSDPYFQPFHLLDPKLDYCEEKNGHQYFSVALSSQHFVGSLHNCLPLRKAKTKNRLWFNIIFTSPDYQFMVMVMMSQEKFYNDTGFWRFLLIPNYDFVNVSTNFSFDINLIKITHATQN